MEERYERNTFRCQFYTANQVVSGCIATLHRRMVDYLNVEAEEHFRVENVHLPGVSEAEAGSAMGDAAYLRRQALLAVVLEESEGASPPSDATRWIKKIPHRVIVGLGPLRIAGSIHLAEGFVLTDVLWTLADRFLVITEAVMTHAEAPGVATEHSVIFMNRQKMDFVVPAT